MAEPLEMAVAVDEDVVVVVLVDEVVGGGSKNEPVKEPQTELSCPFSGGAPAEISQLATCRRIVTESFTFTATARRQKKSGTYEKCTFLNSFVFLFFIADVKGFVDCLLRLLESVLGQAGYVLGREPAHLAVAWTRISAPKKDKNFDVR